ncbi:MAG: 23S rRNA (pseudouridine(1915)-N(3))-methyltransferase RlmH [Bacteroidota bacterium]
MNIKLLCVGKTDTPALQHLVDDYEKRLRFYVKFTHEIIPDLKNTRHLSKAEQKEREGAALLKILNTSDILVLLDAGGKSYSSVDFSTYIQQKMNRGIKQLIFAVGGPYGFSDSVYRRAQEQLSLSKMTFSHQMVRLFFTEQLYRAFTILNNTPYHHE